MLLTQLEQASNKALQRAYIAISELGEKGREVTGETNEFGNVTFQADIEAGKAVFDSLRERDIRVFMFSEEHGSEVRIGKNPKILGVIDELDGSKPYKDGSGRYATMLSFFDGLDPKYDDYLVSGILDYINAQIFLAVKDQGAYIISVKGGDKFQIHCSASKNLNPKTTRIRVDGWFPENLTLAQKLGSFENMFIGSPKNSGASCQYYMDLARGEADIVIECTRKRNLEIAACYGLIREAGGVVITLVDGSWVELGDLKYLEFGQKQNDRIPVVSAANRELANEFVSLTKKLASEIDDFRSIQ